MLSATSFAQSPVSETRRDDLLEERWPLPQAFLFITASSMGLWLAIGVAIRGIVG